MDSQKRDLAYGVFDGDEHESAGRAVTMGVFVGSAWAVAAILAWVMSEAVASGGLDASTRGASSWVLACLAGGVLQQLWFNFRPTSRLGYGGASQGLASRTSSPWRDARCCGSGCQWANRWPGWGSRVSTL